MLPKHEKRYCKRTCAHMRCDILSPFTQLHDTAGLHLLTFIILEPYPSKDIELDLSNIISHS